MIGHINQTRRCHIVTLEDPIEVVHEDDLALIDQREVGTDMPSYADGLKYAVRQDPDVIFIGEIRDEETAEAAMGSGEDDGDRALELATRRAARLGTLRPEVAHRRLTDFLIRRGHAPNVARAAASNALGLDPGG